MYAILNMKTKIHHSSSFSCFVLKCSRLEWELFRLFFLAERWVANTWVDIPELFFYPFSGACTLQVPPMAKQHVTWSVHSHLFIFSPLL